MKGARRKAAALLAWAAACAAWLPLPATAAWLATVERVSDGDTLWVRPLAEEDRLVKLRLLDVDAPERCQPWGEEATQALRAHVLGRPVRVEPVGRDVYRRVLARVQLEGEDLGAWLVMQGHAWSVGPGGYAGGAYRQQEREARAAARGLHGERDPMRPVVFRRWHGPC